MATDTSVTGPGGTKVTAKVVLNRAEVEQWSRLFISRQGADMSRRLVAAAKDEAPVRTGRLRANIKPAPFKMTAPFKGEGGVEINKRDVPYAGYVRWGTRPHVIRCRRPAYALHFYWERMGRWVFFDSVRHPGTKPNYFLERALNRVAREMRR